MSFSAPSVPAPPPPPKAPPMPDIASIKANTLQQDALSRKPGGQAANILTSPTGDLSNNPNNKKNILGQ